MIGDVVRLLHSVESAICSAPRASPDPE
jgi:hypothetical protein